MTDGNSTSMNADDLLAHLAERSKKLRELVHGSPGTENGPECPQAVFGDPGRAQKTENGKSTENHKPLIKHDNSVVFPFFRFPGEDTHAHAHAHARETPDIDLPSQEPPFNSIFISRNNGKTEKKPENPREAAELGVSVFQKGNGKFSEKTEKPCCCVCGNPIETPVDTFWGPDPAHRTCAEAAFQANKAAGRYKP